MYAVLKISHRWTMATALARWTKAVKHARAVKFAQDNLHHKQSMVFEKLVATKIQLELKHVRRRFFRWKRIVRLARLAEDQASSYDATRIIDKCNIHDKPLPLRRAYYFARLNYSPLEVDVALLHVNYSLLEVDVTLLHILTEVLKIQI